MKTSLQNLRKLIREAIRQVLAEAKCPSCGSEGTYHGFSSVECPNQRCVHYSEKQAMENSSTGDPRTAVLNMVKRINGSPNEPLTMPESQMLYIEDEEVKLGFAFDVFDNEDIENRNIHFLVKNDDEGILLAIDSEDDSIQGRNGVVPISDINQIKTIDDLYDYLDI